MLYIISCLWQNDWNWFRSLAELIQKRALNPSCYEVLPPMHASTRNFQNVDFWRYLSGFPSTIRLFICVLHPPTHTQLTTYMYFCLNLASIGIVRKIGSLCCFAILFGKTKLLVCQRHAASKTAQNNDPYLWQNHWVKYVFSECPKSKRSVWETEQKMVRFSARFNFRHLGRSVCLACSD